MLCVCVCVCVYIYIYIADIFYIHISKPKSVICSSCLVSPPPSHPPSMLLTATLRYRLVAKSLIH